MNINLKGKLIAETKVDSHEGMAIKFTLDGEFGTVYLEVNTNDRDKFNELKKQIELGNTILITVKEIK